MLEDHGISGFPDVPKDHQKGVSAGLIRERQMASDKPRSSMRTGRQRESQAMPNLASTTAIDKDAVVCLQNSLAEFTVSLISRANVFMKEVRPGV